MEKYEKNISYSHSRPICPEHTAKNDNDFLKKVNQFVMLITIIIDVSAVGGYFSAYIKGSYALSKLILVFSIMIIGLSLTSYALIKEPEKFRYIAMLGFAVLYSVALAEAGNDFMFVLVFPIITMYVLYFDYKFILVSSLIFGLANLIDMVYIIGVLKTFRSGLAFDVSITVLRLGSVFIYLFAIIGTTSRSNKNNSDKMAFINAEQAKTQKLLDIIVPIVKSVRESSTEVNDSMEQLGSNVNSTSSLLEDIKTYNNRNTKSIERQSVMTQEIQDKIIKTKEESDKMMELSNKSNLAVTDGKKVVETLTKQAIETQSANAKVVESVDALIDNVSKVSDLTLQIAGISGQTNLLALNASIESARAGEAGRGFAVVAEEIRNLADTTNKLTKSIQDIITVLNQNAVAAKETVSAVVENNNKENTDIHNAEEQFAIIGTQIEALNGSVGSIYQSIDEIMESNKAISESISQIESDSQLALERTDEVVRLGDSCMESAEMAKAKMISLSNIVHKADKVIE